MPLTLLPHTVSQVLGYFRSGKVGVTVLGMNFLLQARVFEHLGVPHLVGIAWGGCETLGTVPWLTEAGC